MYAWAVGSGGIGISLPLEEPSEREMLHNWEFSQHFGIVHLQHALVDLAPSIFDARDVEQNGRVFPERTLLDIEDELNGTEVHVA
jgi:hypothetical protein